VVEKGTCYCACSGIEGDYVIKSGSESQTYSAIASMKDQTIFDWIKK